ncbi:MAG: dTDP-4-dehydrorhamnose reductase [Actinomycetota bacterium]
MRMLVTGAVGQLGSELVAAARAAGHDVVATARDPRGAPGVATLDVTDRDAVARAVDLARPAAILHAAAWTAVDDCESDPDRAHRANGEATAHVVAAARAVGARVTYVSTDYVFDGTKPTPYLEGDAPAPRSVYGRSKLAGERAVDPALDATVRISWVCGATGANMVKTILRLADRPGPLRFVDDQRGHPTLADDAARMIVRLAGERRVGVWHVTNQGAVSWWEFAREVMRLAGHDASRVEPIATADLVPPRPAPRPANSVLDNAALRAAGIAPLDDFRVPLARLVAALRAPRSVG